MIVLWCYNFVQQIEFVHNPNETSASQLLQHRLPTLEVLMLAGYRFSELHKPPRIERRWGTKKFVVCIYDGVCRDVCEHYTQSVCLESPINRINIDKFWQLLNDKG
ncbi:hypothetical protein KOR42_55790 [Thalassoglobus neptunius]|uniref:Uncharacterized protein n=1 Tax=Thalassoglobus neptunius TaxID=1938619 RepID=A0A5C5URM7_9PLAN|nr:hypothetical protein KOR42_55790 [Thalassoglobus neptunius]